MPERARLTKRLIDDLMPPGKGRRTVYDTGLPGLCLVMTSSGATAFYLYRRVNGRPRRIRLGGWPEVTIDQARRSAAKLNGDIAAGRDPAAEKRAVRAEITLAELWTDFLENHAKATMRTWRETERLYKRHLERWKGRRLSEITAADLMRLRTRLSTTPTQANRVRALVSKLFNYARAAGWPGENPVARVPRFRETERERYLDRAELRRFLEALAHYGEPKEGEPDVRTDADKVAHETTRDFFVVLLMTGARKSNTCAMRWEDVDLESRVWTIPAAQFKSGRPAAVVLAEPVVNILRDRASKANGSPWVFPSGRSKTGYFMHPYKVFGEVCKRAGLRDLRIHDLRRTLGSWQAAGGASLSIIGKSLGHRDAKTTAIYARLDLDPVRRSVEGATRAMLEAAGVTEGGDDGDA
jgi:integrase